MNNPPIALRSVVLSGGSGTRLWPLSREKYPKQLLNLFGDGTMLQNTVLRLNAFESSLARHESAPIVVSNAEYRFIIAEQLHEIGIMDARLMLEPVGRGTAPALTVAALQALQDAAHSANAEASDAVLLVMPADHLIQDINAFHQAIETGLTHALAGSVVCFGIVPTAAETGYGYIKMVQSAETAAAQLNAAGQASLLDSFVEKPNKATAEQYVASGEYVWNSGLFLVRAQVWLDAIQALAPEMLRACQAAFERAVVDKDFVRLDAEGFGSSPDDTIDYAVMEHAGRGNSAGLTSHVVPMNAGWSDVGAWDAVWEASPKDVQGNVARGKGHAVFEGSNNCLAHAAKRRVVTVLGLDDVVVIDTMDAVLVAHKNSLPNIKNALTKIKAEHIHLTQHWREVFRPWGSYDSLDRGDNFQVKRVIVNPGHVLSLQLHHHRAEHWVVVKGTGKVTKGDQTYLLSENESIYIPIGETHRLENPGKFPLELIEVQSGSYLGEDDIVRLEDIYGRA